MLRLNGLMEKLNDVLKKDKFGSEFKDLLKKHSLTVSEKNGGRYLLTNGVSDFSVDTSKARSEYESAPSPELLTSLMQKLEQEIDMEIRMVSFTNGQEFLRLAIMREKDVRPGMISAEFAGGLCKVIVCTADDTKLRPLDEAVLKRWGMPREVVFSVADRNMCRLLAKTKVKKTSIAEGVNAMEFDLPCKHLGVSFILCNDFRQVVYNYMGAKFLVVAPSCESILILENITNNILEKLGKEIVREYKRSPNPLTTDVFLFTPDKIQIAGHFSVKSNKGHL